MDLELWHQVNQFLIHEARLLDERHFEEWLDLFDDDATYFMPGRTNAWESGEVEDSIHKPGALAIFEDTKSTLETRVKSLRTGKAWGENPPSRTRHLITNVEVDANEEDKALLSVRSNFLVYRAQLETDQDSFVGSRKDVLRRLDNSFKIVSREILMEDVVHTTRPLSIFF